MKELVLTNSVIRGTNSIYIKATDIITVNGKIIPHKKIKEINFLDHQVTEHISKYIFQKHYNYKENEVLIVNAHGHDLITIDGIKIEVKKLTNGSTFKNVGPKRKGESHLFSLVVIETNLVYIVQSHIIFNCETTMQYKDPDVQDLSVARLMDINNCNSKDTITKRNTNLILDNALIVNYKTNKVIQNK